MALVTWKMSPNKKLHQMGLNLRGMREVLFNYLGPACFND